MREYYNFELELSIADVKDGFTGADRTITGVRTGRRSCGYTQTHTPQL